MDWLEVPLGVLHPTDTGAVPASTVQFRFSDSLWLTTDGAEIATCGGSGEGRGGRRGKKRRQEEGRGGEVV